MAGIDKTYTDNYEEYKAFKNWSKTKVVTFFNGHQECISDWIGDFTEKDFNNGEIAIMNSPIWLDAYLLQNCKIPFVLDRMKSVHNEKFINDSKNVDFTKIPDGYEKNRKITMRKNKHTKFPIHNKPYGDKNKWGNKNKWWLQCKNNFWYNSETNTWVHNSSLYPSDTNMACVKSIKALVRHLRSQYLPKGIEFVIRGNYIGEEYSILVH
jgi:hypothetical protein